MLQRIPGAIGAKGGTFTQWNELLGWFSPSPDAPTNENLTFIKKQLYLLWNHRIVKLLLGKYIYCLTHITTKLAQLMCTWMLLEIIGYG